MRTPQGQPQSKKKYATHYTSIIANTPRKQSLQDIPKIKRESKQTIRYEQNIFIGYWYFSRLLVPCNTFCSIAFIDARVPSEKKVDADSDVLVLINFIEHRSIPPVALPYPQKVIFDTVPNDENYGLICKNEKTKSQHMVSDVRSAI